MNHRNGCCESMPSSAWTQIAHDSPAAASLVTSRAVNKRPWVGRRRSASPFPPAMSPPPLPPGPADLSPFPGHGMLPRTRCCPRRRSKVTSATAAARPRTPRDAGPASPSGSSGRHRKGHCAHPPRGCRPSPSARALRTTAGSRELSVVASMAAKAQETGGRAFGCLRDEGCGGEIGTRVGLLQRRGRGRETRLLSERR